MFPAFSNRDNVIDVKPLDWEAPTAIAASKVFPGSPFTDHDVYRLVSNQRTAPSGAFFVGIRVVLFGMPPLPIQPALTPDCRMTFRVLCGLGN